MKNVPINEAEAVLEAFWDGGSSEHPTDKRSLLDAYTVAVTGEAIASITQSWCALQVMFERGAPGSAITMTRDCDIVIAGYDIFRVFASIPSWVTLTVRATIDGRETIVIDGIAGRNTNDEFDGKINGRHLSALAVEYRLEEERPVNMQVLWLGLANQQRQKEMELAVSPYASDWVGLLKSDAECEHQAEAFRPQLGILIDPDEIEELRGTLRTGPLSNEYKKLLGQAEESLSWEPEKDIDRYVAKPDRRWVRNRDMERRSTAGVMELLAFVGLVERNYSMTRMAARMALSACHCEYWSESIIGTMPGTTWHHRSFTEEIYSRACGLVLDWAGFALTRHAKQLIRDAIIMKGLPRIESDFKRMEYIRHMNQGIVFSSGRIVGTLALLEAYPRYNSLIDEAERDLHEMIDNYVHDDGGTLEGMAYWSYTFSSAMPVILALARHRGKSLSEYATDTLRKTGDFGLGMLSTVGLGGTYLPVNDAHADVGYPPGLLAAYARLSQRQEWRVLYNAADKDGIADMYHLIMAPRESAPRESSPREAAAERQDRFDSFKTVGQMSLVRTLGDGGTTLFHLCSGPTDQGHFHEDKGSIIIEAGGESLAADRGVTDYHHPEVNLIGMASRHNLVYPESTDGRLMRQPRDEYGGRLTSAVWEREILLACSDNREAWETDLFTCNYRRICSPTPNLILLDDELIMPNPRAVSFRINTSLPVWTGTDTAEVRGSRYNLRVTPLNWTAEETEGAEEGVDSHLVPTNVIRMETGVANTHRLITLLEIRRVGAPDSWEALRGERPTVKGTQGSIAIDSLESQALTVTVERPNGESITSRCDGGVWTL
jgi:hypothetical protein